MLEDVRASLLDEARQSPALLSDLAGLESYIAESYTARAFIELLQNADDAGASQLVVEATPSHLFVANNGRDFSRADFESLCRSAASTKTRGSGIGYRGIGFKSVVGLADTVQLLSGSFEATFSRQRTREALPQAARVPLVRIPHPITPDEWHTIETKVGELRTLGFTTVFVFAALVPYTVGVEFEQFDVASLLFLRSVKQVELRSADGRARAFSAQRESFGTVERVTIESDGGTASWRVLREADLALALGEEDGRPVPLPEVQAVAHAFLPTAEATGFGFKFNGDLSTDPSRTKIILDDLSRGVLSRVAVWLAGLLQDALLVPDAENEPEHVAFVRAVAPTSDARAYAYGRPSVRRELAALLAQHASALFQDVVTPPVWMSPGDGVGLARAAGLRTIGPAFLDAPGAVAFFRFLGTRDASLLELARGAVSTAPGPLGALDLVARAVSAHQTAQLASSDWPADARVWTVGGERQPLAQLVSRPRRLDEGFVQGLVERGISPRGLRAFLGALAGTDVAVALLGEPEVQLPQGLDVMPGTALMASTLSLKRWRGAEQQAQAYFEALGWQVRDVSRQNVGYDLECKDGAGHVRLVEVKSIDAPNRPFVLTTNEEAVARERGEAYVVTLVRQTAHALEINVIERPLDVLSLARQCRAWVWECREYPYAPVLVPFDDS